MLQTSVEIVNPGGTRRPALVISASPDPLPPSRSFMCRLPSALPRPKEYTCLPLLEPGGRDLGFAVRRLLDCFVRFAIYISVAVFRVAQGFSPAVPTRGRRPRQQPSPRREQSARYRRRTSCQRFASAAASPAASLAG